MVRGDAWSSRAIEGFGGGWPSHMANLLADGSVWDARDNKITYGGQSYPAGVHHRPAGYLEAENKRWAILEPPAGGELKYNDWVKTLESQEGKPYDQIGIMDFAKGLVTGKYEDRNWGPDDPSASAAWFCDEYAVWAAGINGLVPWPIPVPLFTLTPGSALIFLMGAKWQVTASQNFN